MTLWPVLLGHVMMRSGCDMVKWKMTFCKLPTAHVIVLRLRTTQNYSLQKYYCIIVLQSTAPCSVLQVVRTNPLMQSCGRKTAYVSWARNTSHVRVIFVHARYMDDINSFTVLQQLTCTVKRVSNMGMLTCFMLVTLPSCRGIFWVPVRTTPSNFLAKLGTTPTKHEHETRITSEEVFATWATVSTCCRSIHLKESFV